MQIECSMATTTNCKGVDYIQIDDEMDEEMSPRARATVVQMKQEVAREADDEGMDVSLPPPEWFDGEGWTSPAHEPNDLIAGKNSRISVQQKRRRESATEGTGGKKVALAQSKLATEAKPKTKRRKKLWIRKKKAAEMPPEETPEEEKGTPTGDVSEGEDLDTALPVQRKVVAQKTPATDRKRRKLHMGNDDVEDGWPSDSDNDLVVLFETAPAAATSALMHNGRKNIKCEFTNGSDIIWPRRNKLERDIDSPSSTAISKYGVISSADRLIMNAISGYRNQFPKEFNQFNKKIWTHLTTNLQNDHTFTWKMRVRSILHNQIRLVFPNSLLLVVGSTVNGCGAYNSDMDLCLGIPCPVEHFDNSKRYAGKQLRKLKYILKLLDIVRQVEYIPAKVPILKMNFAHPYSNLEVDINVNNFAGVYNSFLLHNYSRIDDRFSAICLLVKHWAKVKGIGDACGGYLNSYSLILMVLHFLQCGVEPPVLPNLQQLYPDRFSCRRQFSDITFFTDLPTPLPEIPQNDRTVGELLVAFFDYYNRFDFNRYAVSIRRGCVFPRTELPPNTQRFRLFIEEPFDLQNTARCVTNDEQWMVILDTFGKAAKALSPYAKQAPDLLRIGIRI